MFSPLNELANFSFLNSGGDGGHVEGHQGIVKLLPNLAHMYPLYISDVEQAFALRNPSKIYRLGSREFHFAALRPNLFEKW